MLKQRAAPTRPPTVSEPLTEATLGIPLQAVTSRDHPGGICLCPWSKAWISETRGPGPWPRGPAGPPEGALSRGSVGLGTAGQLPRAGVAQCLLATSLVSLAIAGFLGCDLDNDFSLLNNHSGKRLRAGLDRPAPLHKQHPLPTLPPAALPKCFQTDGLRHRPGPGW